MSNSMRQKDTGKYDHPVRGGASGEPSPKTEKLDLTKEPTKPVTSNFKRPALGSEHGRARASGEQGGPVPAPVLTE
jgi:hypothetical protein